MTYAIRNKRTGRWVYGTDYRYSPPHQRTSKDTALLFDDHKIAKLEFEIRRCSNAYEIVPVKLEELEETERQRKEE